MIRQENVTSRDLELLNIALDHALTPQEQVEFDKRLTKCPYLATLYQQQRRLKTAMGQLPCCKPPYNFTLTRAEARKAKRSGFLQPMFGWASLVSALLVAVIFGSELIFRTISLTAPMPANNIETSLTQEEAPMAAMPEESAGFKTLGSEQVYLLNWGYGATGLGGIGGMGGGSDVAETGGMTVNIYISPETHYAEDLAVAGVGAGEIVEDVPMDAMISAYPEEAVPEEVVPEAEIAEQEVAEQETTPEAMIMAIPTSMEREAPRIYGIDAENVGTILKMTPDSSAIQPEQVHEEQLRTGEESRSERFIPIQVSIALLSAALLFGLLWLFLKFRH